MSAWLADALSRDALVLTGSRRLARHLRKVHAGEMLAAGHLAWQTPAIHALEDWSRLQVERATTGIEQRLPLDAFSAGILWERCLQGQLAVPALRGVVRQARDAWQRLENWMVPLPEAIAAARSADERLFAEAARSYQASLEDGPWRDRDGMLVQAATLIEAGGLSVPGRVTLVGFDRLVPAVRHLLQALAQRGCDVVSAPEPPPSQDLQRVACADSDAEMRTAGAWARAVLETDPDASVAIVNPNLQDGAERLARLVREGLAPGWQYGHARLRESVNVSYGRRLSDYPAIANALLLLRWIHHGLSITEVSLLLRSRSVLGDPIAERSRIELYLRRLPDRAWTAGDLLRAIKRPEDSPEADAWCRGLEGLVALQAASSDDASPAHWASVIDSYLADWEWPGSAALDSEEFQLVNRWRDLLNELAASVRVTPVISFGEAIARIAARAAEIVFQPEGSSGVVNLLGTLEAAGMTFDYLWVSGLHSGQWPSTGNPSALLSRRLQTDYAMPDATPSDTLAFSRRVLHRLAASGEHVVFSWPRNDGEAELAASSLLDELSCAAYDGPADPGWHALAFASGEPLEIIVDDPVPAVAPDEVVRGGAHTVQRQAVEPLGAFVFGRLGVSEPKPIEAGISAALRGNLIHGALDRLFAHGPSQQQIRQWGESEISDRLGSAIDSVLATHQRLADATLERLLAMERTRLYFLLREFLSKELERTDFTILDVERSLDYRSHGVRLELRVDRIDRLADGSLLIIDYKTGAPKNLLDRHGDPQDLQLVVYADALDTEIGGLALINLDRRAISYKGTGGSVEWDTGRQAEWPERLAAWRADVNLAMRQLADGDVRINLQRATADARELAILSRVEEYRRDG